MDKLKNFIDANRDAFKEDEMLPEGHFERFEQKLPKPRKNRAALYSLSAFAIAASIRDLFHLLKHQREALQAIAVMLGHGEKTVVGTRQGREYRFLEHIIIREDPFALLQ